MDDASDILYCEIKTKIFIMDANNINPLVYIVILNWNNATDTIECLDSLVKMNYKNYVIILIDNGSSDNSLTEIVSWTQKNSQRGIQEVKAEDLDSDLVRVRIEQRMVLIKSKENLGF